MSTSTSSNSTPSVGTATTRRRGQLVSNRAAAQLSINIRRTPEIPVDGSDNIVARRIPMTEVFIQAERAADREGYQWFLVYEKTPGDLGWVREDVLLEHIASPSPSLGPNPSPTPVPTPPTETQLFFETDSYAVRILRVRSQLSMNVYNKSANRTDVAGGVTVQLPQLDENSSWQTYLAQHGGRLYLARFIPRANTELVISDGNTGAIALRQAGFRAEGIAFIR